MLYSILRSYVVKPRLSLCILWRYRESTNRTALVTLTVRENKLLASRFVRIIAGERAAGVIYRGKRVDTRASVDTSQRVDTRASVDTSQRVDTRASVDTSQRVDTRASLDTSQRVDTRASLDTSQRRNFCHRGEWNQNLRLPNS